ncbi:MAG: CopD family protein [Candidatus Sedimenticola sp. 20ELBAFRAG]
MLSIALTLHLLASVVWVGGMFFAHMALRPVAAEQLEPPQRLPLLYGVLGRFFPWVWLSVILILVTGFWVLLVPFDNQAALHVYLMMGIGLVMAGIFMFIYFFPFQRMGFALSSGELPVAGASMALIRRLIGVNLALGLITTVVAAFKPF